MRGLLACAILALLATGCAFHVKEYRQVKDVDIYIGGRTDSAGAERDAASFENQINKQFDSNITLPRLPFQVGRYIDSWCYDDGIWFIRVDGKF